MAEAEEAERTLRNGGTGDRPLHGVPVAIKDDTDVEGDVTPVGTRAHGPPARADSEVVRRLRDAGAIVIGKTNVPEYVIWRFTETPTWGATRNPWNLHRTPGGSSGGSAAAVAGGLVGGALGSDGAGSIRIPASCCGVFGLKPQRGRISIAPHTDDHFGWHGLSVYGPLVPRVRDAALFLDATAADRPPRPFAEAAATPPGRLRIALSFKVPAERRGADHPSRPRGEAGHRGGGRAAPLARSRGRAPRPRLRARHEQRPRPVPAGNPRRRGGGRPARPPRAADAGDGAPRLAVPRSTSRARARA